MGKGLYFAVFVPAVIAGLFMGISLKTGEDISPEGLTGKVVDQLSQTPGMDEPSKSVLSQTKFWLIVVSIIATIADILFIIAAGGFSIISAIGGYFGMLLLVFNLQFGVWLFILGFLAVLFAPSD